KQSVASRSTSACVRKGLPNRGPPPYSNDNPTPSASPVTRIPENRIAPPKSSRSTGKLVTSAEISGVLHISKKLYLFFISQYSGIKRPARRIIQTGGLSVACDNAALINKSFCKVLLTTFVYLVLFLFFQQSLFGVP